MNLEGNLNILISLCIFMYELKATKNHHYFHSGYIIYSMYRSWGLQTRSNKISIFI